MTTPPPTGLSRAPDDVVRLTYLIETATEEPARMAAKIASDQSTGTFVPLPGETPELKARVAACVVALRDLPPAEAPSFPQDRVPGLARYRRAEAVVDFPLDAVGTDLVALTERLDDTDGLGPGARGHLGLEAVAATGRPEVVVVDRGEQHPHERLARTGLGVRHLLDREDLGRVAEPGLDECAHGTAFRCCSACFLRGRTSGTTTGRVRLCRGSTC